jgi:hypothetical protein
MVAFESWYNFIESQTVHFGQSVHMQDSGVVLVDTWKHFVPMLLTTRLNGPDRDGNSEMGKRGVYDMVYGDKETFWLSWEMTEVDHTPGLSFVVPQMVGLVCEVSG